MRCQYTGGEIIDSRNNVYRIPLPSELGLLRYWTLTCGTGAVTACGIMHFAVRYLRYLRPCDICGICGMCGICGIISGCGICGNAVFAVYTVNTANAAIPQCNNTA